MQRGLSPLISTVILIALVVVVFVITGSWFRQFSEEILRVTGKESAKQITCSSPEVFLEIDTACYNQDEAILVLGAGKLKFENFIIALSSNEQVTLETTSGLDQFKIKKFTLSTDSQDLTDESREKLESIDFTKTQQIKVVPQIINENELAVCQNLIKTKTNIECCKGGNACGCSDNSDCANNFPNNICDNSFCVECGNDNDCENDPNKPDHCDTTNKRCVECLENQHCQQEEQCIDNQCVQQLSCNDIGSSDYNVIEGTPESLCLTDREVRLKINSISNEIEDFKIKIKDSSQTQIYDSIISISNGETTLPNVMYHDSFQTNNFLDNIEIIPRINGQNGIEECPNAALIKTLKVADNIAICCDKSIECNQNGEPQGSQSCCDRDCGNNPFTASAIKKLGDPFEEEDQCNPFDTNKLNEKICDEIIENDCWVYNEAQCQNNKCLAQ